MNRTLSTLVSIALLGGFCHADIPGLFVLQEAKVVDPGPKAATVRTSFGAAQVAVVGDLDKDGIQDLAIGAPLQDSGAIYLQRLTSSGAPKSAPVQFNARHPLLKPLLETGPYADQFGAGLAMIQNLSKTQSCGVLMASSGAVRKLWLLKICRDEATLVPDITQAVTFDTSSAALTGLNLNGTSLGSTIAVVDTLTSGERVVAIGAQTDGVGASSMEGKVILVSVNPATLSMKHLSVLPKAYGTGDPIGEKLVAGEGFGLSIAPLRLAGGARGLAVVSPAWAPVAGGTVTGRVFTISFDAQWQPASVGFLAGTSDPAKTGPLYSVASEDFDHDGLSDLVLGFHADGGAGVTQLGMVKIALLDPSRNPKDSTFIRKGAMGFVDSGAYLAASCRWGTRVVASDFDGDGQVDLVVGSRGNLASAAVDVVGSVWPIRLKAKPWRISAIDTIGIANTSWTGRTLADYIKGNELKWSLLPSQIQPDPVASCRLSGTGSATRIECVPGISNGITKARIAVRDTGNIPVDLLYTDTLEFPVKVSGINSPPERLKEIPRISMSEDHADTAVLKFANFYRDPEGQPMSIGIQAFDGTTTDLIGYRQSSDKDTLFIKPVQFKHGLCSLRVVVTDNFNATIEDKIRIEIVHVNHRPIGTADDLLAKENDSTAVLDVLANDIDNDKDPLSVAISIQPKHGRAEVAGSKIRYVPSLFFNGFDTIWYVAKDPSDATSDPVPCRVVVAKADSTPIVYKPMRDTVLQSEVDTVRIHTDSLFFSGAMRWSFDVVAPISHTCQSIAKVSYQSDSRMLYLVPLPYQSGTCRVVLQHYGRWQVTDTMQLTIPFVAHPYKFKKEKMALTIAPGERQTLEFDSLDLDRVEMEYVPGLNWPSWMTVRGFWVDLAPDGKSEDVMTTLMARHKVLQGDPAATFTDTLALVVLIDANSGLRGRRIGGLSLETTASGKLLLHAGDQPVRWSLFNVRGAVSEVILTEPHRTSSIDLSRWGGTIFLRLDEGGRSKIVPLFLKH